MDSLPEEDVVQALGEAANDSEYELAMLREQISMLTKQFYQDRQQWLEEKRRLQDAAKQAMTTSSAPGDDVRPGIRAGHEHAGSGMLLGSEAESDTGREDASQASAREPSSSFASSRSASPNQTSSSAASASTAAISVGGTHSELLLVLADLQRQLEESQRKQESASVRWALEREALQRQVHALISMSAEAAGVGSTSAGEDGRGGAGAATTRGSPGQEEVDEEERQRLNDRVSELESIVEELQAERENLEEHVRILAADATRARLATRDSVPTPTPSATPRAAQPAEDPSSSAPREPQAAAVAVASSRSSGDGEGGGGGGGAAGGFHAPTLRDSVSVAELLMEKAELERELRRYSQECVPVPRSEYTELCSLRSQLVFMEAEMQQLREEAAEAARLQAAAEAELAQAAQECVTLPTEEYQRLMRLEAEAVRARGNPVELAAAAGVSSVPPSPHDGVQSVPLEEHRRLLAAVQERDALAEQVTCLQRKLLAAEGARALRETEEEVDRRHAAAAAEAGASGDDDTAAAAAAAAAAGRGVDVAEMQSELFVLREQLAAVVAASVAESGRRAAQVAELQEEVETLRSKNAALLADTGVVRHALAAGQVQASDEARAAAAAAAASRAAAVQELSEARRQIAALEEELSEARREAEAALAVREQLSIEAAVARDAALRTREALADCLAQRCSEGGGMEALDRTEAPAAREGAAIAGAPGDGAAAGAAADVEVAEAHSRIEALEAELAAARAESAAVARQLDAAKLELAEARELGLLFQSKRDVIPQSKRVIRGLPQEWIQGSAAVAARQGGGSAGAGAVWNMRHIPAAAVAAAVAAAEVAAAGPTAHPVAGLAAAEGDGEDSVGGSLEQIEEVTSVTTL